MGNKTNPMDVQTDFDRHKERHQESHTEPIHSASLKWILVWVGIFSGPGRHMVADPGRRGSGI